MLMIRKMVSPCGLSETDKSDLSADIYTDLLGDKIAKYNGSVTVGTWISLVARQAMMNRIKSRKGKLALPIEEAITTEVQDDVSHRMEMDDIRNMVDNEPDPLMKRLLHGKFWQGLTLAELAEANGISTSGAHIKIREWLVVAKRQLVCA